MTVIGLIGMGLLLLMALAGLVDHLLSGKFKYAVRRSYHKRFSKDRIVEIYFDSEWFLPGMTITNEKGEVYECLGKSIYLKKDGNE